MKRLALLAILFGIRSVAFAELSDFDMTAEGKMMEQSVSTESDKKKTSQEWAYDVTMVNKSAKDYGNLKIKYIIFIKDAKEGGKPGDTRLVRKQGETTADAIKAHAKFAFQTNKVEVKKTQLQGGWTYVNGARPRAADSLAGIWVRVYDGDKQVAQFSNPPTIQTREKWDTK